MRLLADVNVSRLVVGHLRAAGVEVHHVPEILDPRVSDRTIVAHARSIDAILVSHDQDFSALLAMSGAPGPSLINLRTSTVEHHRIATLIPQAMALAADELAEGAIVTVEDRSLRLHLLPFR